MQPQTPVLLENNAKKSYGFNGGGFKFGMNTRFLTGKGMQLAYNAYLKKGEWHKMKGNSQYYHLGDATVTNIELLGEYQKADGSFQLVFTYYDGTNHRFRALDDDGTLVTPSSDVAFTSSDFGWQQIAIYGYLSNDVAVSTGQELYSWDGTALTAVTNTYDNPKWISAEGRRLNMIANGIARFSRADQVPITVFEGGIGADGNGEYRVNIPGIPVGIYATGAGTLIAFNSGMEMHKVTELDDGTGIFNETRILDFQYRGEGVNEPRKIAIAPRFIYAITSTGLQKIDPFSGQHTNLIGADSGKIKDYWDTLNLTGARAVYSPKEQAVIITTATTESGAADLQVVFYEETEAFAVRPASIKSLAVVDRQLYGGSSIDDVIFKVFDESTYQNGRGENSTFRIISEWDAITTVHEKKLPIDLLLNMFGVDGNTITLNIYTDGDISDPVSSFTFNVEDVTDSSGLISALGSYVMALGEPDELSGSDYIDRKSFNDPFVYWCWEIVEESQENIAVYDIVLEHTYLEETYEATPYPKTLFTI